MKPRILAWTLNYWHSKEHAQAQSEGVIGLAATIERIQKWFSPIETFIACGSWSEPEFCPVANVAVINSGLTLERPYGPFAHYGKAAISAGIAYALNRNDWEYLVLLDHDGLLGDLNLPVLFTEFAARAELVMAPQWLEPHMIGGPLNVWKREGAIRIAHYRKSSNFQDPEEPLKPVWEREHALIFKHNHWWNPWPETRSCLGDTATKLEDILQWPMTCHISNELASHFLTHNTARLITL